MVELTRIELVTSQCHCDVIPLHHSPNYSDVIRFGFSKGKTLFSPYDVRAPTNKTPRALTVSPFLKGIRILIYMLPRVKVKGENVPLPLYKSSSS
jgi:hypothetical protein